MQFLEFSVSCKLKSAESACIFKKILCATSNAATLCLMRTYKNSVIFRLKIIPFEQKKNQIKSMYFFYYYYCFDLTSKNRTQLSILYARLKGTRDDTKWTGNFALFNQFYPRIHVPYPPHPRLTMLRFLAQQNLQSRLLQSVNISDKKKRVYSKTFQISWNIVHVTYGFSIKSVCMQSNLSCRKYFLSKSRTLVKSPKIYV